MAEQLLDRSKIGTGGEHVCGKGMSERMSGNALMVNACRCYSPFKKFSDNRVMQIVTTDFAGQRMNAKGRSGKDK